MLAVLRLGILSYWMNGYWSGSVVALGGALALGALPRVRKYSRPMDAVVLAIGLAILANSRPYEGLIFSIPIAGALALWISGMSRPSVSVFLGRVVLPTILVLAVTGAGMGYYYLRVTGSPFRMTYQVNRGTYATAPYFLWQSPRPEPEYHDVVTYDRLASAVSEFTRKGALVFVSGRLHGQSWKAVAKKYSIDPTTKNKAGLLTNVAKGQQDAALSAAAFAAGKGVLLGPIKGSFGYYVLEVTKINPATTRSLAQSSARLFAPAGRGRARDRRRTGRSPGRRSGGPRAP